MRPLVIMNPRAGVGVGVARLREILDRWLPEADLQATAGPGSAATLASRARAAGYDTIVVAGGDGLAHEVVNGLAPDFAGARLGLLPLGTGNDLARTLGIPRRVERAARLLRNGASRWLDLVRIRERAGPAHRRGGLEPPAAVRYCVNMTVAGLGARIELDARTKRRWRGLAYLRRAATGLIRPESHDTTIELDGGERVRLDAVLIAIANGRFMGGGIPIAPRAEPDDGLLEIVAIRASSLPELVSLVPRILLGRHEKSDRVFTWRARSVVLASSRPLWLNVDGEILGDRPASFEILPRVIEWIVR